ncbi:MAG: hypothetical protein M3R24_11755 [Chloroflexota bacterium]|nr:hypothetical protein [Chloroflexota bacterium]
MLDRLAPDQIPSDLVHRLQSRHHSNAVQFVVHAALDRLPPWPDAPSDVWNGLSSVASSLQQVYDNFVQAEAGMPPLQPGPYL